MTVESDPQRSDAFYEKFYKGGGWKYSLRRERRWHRRYFIAKFKLHRGMRVLDVGCGCGFYTHLLNRMGFDCVGIDRSQVGIDWARNHYPSSTYLCCDLSEMPFDPGSFDVIYARGLSHYNYDLTSRQAIHTTIALIRFLRPDGLFTMISVTDLSGRRTPGRIWNNSLEDYRRHMALFGESWSVESCGGYAVCGFRNEPVMGSVVPQANIEPLRHPQPLRRLEPALST